MAIHPHEVVARRIPAEAARASCSARGDVAAGSGRVVAGFVRPGGFAATRLSVPLLAAVFAAPAGAAVIDLESDRETFEDLLVDAVVEDFEDEPLGTLEGTTTLGGSGLAVGLAGSDGWELAVTDSTTFSFNTTEGGANHLRSAFGTGAWTLSLATPEPVLAFGFSITGFQDLLDAGGLSIALFDDGTPVAELLSPDPGDFDEHFHGILSDTLFDEVRITVEGTDFAGIDDVVFAAIPGPSPLLLLAGPLLAGRRRRR